MKRKGRIIKNILSLLLAPALVFTPVSGNIIGGGLSSSLTVSAAETLTYGDYEYEVNNNTVTITKYKGSETTLTIPDKINGIPVTGIGGGAFENFDSINSIILSENITDIADDAFHYL